MSCEQLHTFSPFSYYVELGINATGDSQQLKSGNYCDAAKKRIDDLKLGQDGVDRSIPDKSGRSVPDGTVTPQQKGTDSTPGT
jgi:hypothetical protein